MEVKTKNFKNVLLKWYKNNKREYSWRNDSDPWSIYLLEVISQQTQLSRADKYYKKFIKEEVSKKNLEWDRDIKKKLFINYNQIIEARKKLESKVEEYKREEVRVKAIPIVI